MGLDKYQKERKMHIKPKNFPQKVLWFWKIVVPLHPLSKNESIEEAFFERFT